MSMKLTAVLLCLLCCIGCRDKAPAPEVIDWVECSAIEYEYRDFLTGETTTGKVEIGFGMSSNLYWRLAKPE